MSDAAAVVGIDWDAVTRETTELLQQMIRLDTSNPPGNEYLVADWLEGILHGEGFETERYDAGEGRHSLRAVYRGDGSKRPLMLLSHADVVPCEPEKWIEPPFAGVIRDGVLWGRGAMDDKGLAVMHLMSLLLFKRLGFASTRDLVYLCTADEEAGAPMGVAFIEREHPEVMDVEYVLNEGDYGVTTYAGTQRPVIPFTVAEKNLFWVTLRADGPPGHGSVPRSDNCVERLISAVARVIAWERPIRITSDTRPLVETFAREGLLPDASEGEALVAFAAANPKVRARLFDGISVTSFHAGYKHNVIPSHAEATLDIRLLPDSDRDAFLEALRAQLADDDISIEIVHTEDSPPSSSDTELARVCEEVVKEFIEDANFTASMCSGGTDSRYFRRRGIPAYGFNPILATEEEAASIHSHNERITLDNIRLGTRTVFEVVRRMCAL